MEKWKRTYTLNLLASINIYVQKVDTQEIVRLLHLIAKPSKLKESAWSRRTSY